ncbi:hypothetical protein HDK90DRAFT_47138 [Phyllosticta capitalensis]|uniref:Uncharacterized protein n=1 Tax=Phyllosticta capitalensis TaxID=121624 RepID=A0ABR1YE99_9PEZI
MLTRTRAKHVTALALLLFFGILPLLPFFLIVYHPFTLKPATCQDWDLYGIHVYYSSPGVQGLFTIDRTYGSFPFWFVKLIDVIWDLFVGRGFQWLAGWVSYIVFSSVLLRTIEESQIPFRTFLKLSTETPSLTSVWFLLKDMPRFSRIRLILQFSYIALASSYVLAMPTLLSAITGYMSKSTSFTKLPGSDSLVRSSDFRQGMMVIGNLSGVAPGTCYPTDFFQGLSIHEIESCTRDCWVDSSPNTNFCANCPDPITINGQNYTGKELSEALEWNTDINWDTFCYGTTGFHLSIDSWMQASECLPDPDKGGSSYQWGFSAPSSSIVLIVQLVWGCSMYIIWLEAQMKSQLIRKGYRLNELRGAIAFAAAAEAATGMEASELQSSSVGSLEKLLYDKRATVDSSVFSRELPFADTEIVQVEDKRGRSSSPTRQPPAYSRLAGNSNFS